MTGPAFFACLFTVAHKVSAVVPARTSEKVYLHLLSEIGEIGEEASIAAGELYKSPGADALVGEAADVINCLADLVWLRCAQQSSEARIKTCEQIAAWVGIEDFDSYRGAELAFAKKRFARMSADLRDIHAMTEPSSAAMSSDEIDASARLMRAAVDLAKAQEPELTAERFGAIYAAKCEKWRSKATAA